MLLDGISKPALILLAAVVGGTVFLPQSVAMAHDDQSLPTSERHIGNHIDGHIAFLKAELNITAAQEALWDKVAAVMRADVSDFNHLTPRAPAKIQAPPTALQHLEERVAYTALRAKCEQRFLEAFRPLYETLSEAQRHNADELLGQGREEL